ncbi:hypothetical protein CIHG_03140 [Coccidioides immitis H538.4]|uniref:Uncharacterized protein n=1 Tax=Coccidioides immitis H538.4 TaxID=396776 RepID=A0A0J8RL37_COCIT|nr:hypothetical protein CIHG_03140 [Coccidioides immitis H538.4]
MNLLFEQVHLLCDWSIGIIVKLRWQPIPIIGTQGHHRWWLAVIVLVAAVVVVVVVGVGPVGSANCLHAKQSRGSRKQGTGVEASDDIFTVANPSYSTVGVGRLDVNQSD